MALRLWSHRESAFAFVMAHINLYPYNPHQASASHTFTNIDANVNADAETDAGAPSGQAMAKNESDHSIKVYSHLESPFAFFFDLYQGVLDQVNVKSENHYLLL